MNSTDGCGWVLIGSVGDKKLPENSVSKIHSLRDVLNQMKLLLSERDLFIDMGEVQLERPFKDYMDLSSLEDVAFINDIERAFLIKLTYDEANVLLAGSLQEATLNICVKLGIEVDISP